jgi:hypothetical protein
MSEVWKTKYGSRRVRHDPPTLEEAIFAAKGITEDIEGQAEIAASLMGLSVDSVRTEIMKTRQTTLRQERVISIDRGSHRSVVVERRVSRRVPAGKRL